ncbi:NUDIX domain-containing protein [Actinomadura parmotrematis]|uniref:NUDIX hydrolase n=1 Tax=Actinomadura parmotrematis TaxID=2864039 RepID=A0ABS7FQW2_9ACTN|nr:NUDIX hydrolase [Actinomadura parmotrematis]MBW8482788.1 NUDIX hydrolase [Actinomadura parmotrematis]
MADPAHDLAPDPAHDPAHDLAYYASLPRTRGAAAALLLDDLGRMLLVKPTYRPHWQLPGGVIEAGESPLAACVRECGEELGLRPRLSGLLCVDFGPPRGGIDAVNVFVFGGALDAAEHAAIVLPPEELSDHALVAPHKAAAFLPPHIARRTGPCLAALAAGRPVYLEDGRPAPFAA